jgi:hypothetical protein
LRVIVLLVLLWLPAWAEVGVVVTEEADAVKIRIHFTEASVSNGTGAVHVDLASGRLDFLQEVNSGLVTRVRGEGARITIETIGSPECQVTYGDHDLMVVVPTVVNGKKGSGIRPKVGLDGAKKSSCD